MLPIGAVLPDPANLRDRIDFNHVAELSEAMAMQGFDLGRALSVVEISPEDYARQVAKVPERERAWRFPELADFFAAGIAELNEMLAKGRMRMSLVGGKLYMLLDGEHRLRAARKAGLREVPVTVRTVSSDSERVMLQLSANKARAASGRELLAGLIRLKRAGTPYEDAKKAVGKIETWTRPRWELVDVLPDEVLDHLERKLSIEEAQALAEIYRFVGKSKLLPDKPSADRTVRGIVSDWSAIIERDGGRKPPQYIQGRIEELRRDFGGQGFLMADAAPVPSETQLLERSLGQSFSAWREAMARLGAELAPLYRKWKSQPGNERRQATEFVRASALVGHTNTKRLLDELGVAHEQLRVVLCALCAGGEEHAACGICMAGPEASEIINRIVEELADEDIKDRDLSGKLSDKLFALGWRGKFTDIAGLVAAGRRKHRVLDAEAGSPGAAAEAALAAILAAGSKPQGMRPGCSGCKHKKASAKKVRKKSSKAKKSSKPSRPRKPRKPVERDAEGQRLKRFELKKPARAVGEVIEMQVLEGETRRRMDPSVSNRGFAAVSGKFLLLAPKPEASATELDVPEVVGCVEDAGRLLAITYKDRDGIFTHLFDRMPRLYRCQGVWVVAPVKWRADVGFTS